MEQKVFLTENGLKELEKELHLLKTVKMPEIVEKIKEARGFGDLSENAEYDAARNEQAVINGKIQEIEAKIRNKEIIQEVTDTHVVSLGCGVKIKNHKTNRESMVRIVGTTESNAFENKISNESPIGKAVLGKAVGDIVDVVNPSGTMKVEILAISK